MWFWMFMIANVCVLFALGPKLLKDFQKWDQGGPAGFDSQRGDPGLLRSKQVTNTQRKSNTRTMGATAKQTLKTILRIALATTVGIWYYMVGDPYVWTALNQWLSGSVATNPLGGLFSVMIGLVAFAVVQ